jgi:hypothetical protein
MTALAVIFALVASLGIGYQCGRHAGSASPLRRPTWKQRTSRVALGKRAIGLVLLVSARRVQRSFPAPRAIPAGLGVWGLRLVEPQWRRSRASRRRFRY